MLVERQEPLRSVFEQFRYNISNILKQYSKNKIISDSIINASDYQIICVRGFKKPAPYTIDMSMGTLMTIKFNKFNDIYEFESRSNNYEIHISGLSSYFMGKNEESFKIDIKAAINMAWKCEYNKGYSYMAKVKHKFLGFSYYKTELIQPENIAEKVNELESA